MRIEELEKQAAAHGTNLATIIVRTLKISVAEWFKNNPDSDEIDDPEITALLDFIKSHKAMFKRSLPVLQQVFPGLN